ncbi:MAG: hypothetical protein ACUVXD_12340 [Thermodesulfobacteriota bacterium]
MRVALWGDCQDFLDHYRLQYGAFETHPRPIPEADVLAQFLSTGPTLVLNGRKIELPCISHPFEEAQSLIWEEVACRVTDFHLLHGAVLVRDGGGPGHLGPPWIRQDDLGPGLGEKKLDPLFGRDGPPTPGKRPHPPFSQGDTCEE